MGNIISQGDTSTLLILPLPHPPPSSSSPPSPPPLSPPLPSLPLSPAIRSHPGKVGLGVAGVVLGVMGFRTPPAQRSGGLGGRGQLPDAGA